MYIYIYISHTGFRAYMSIWSLYAKWQCFNTKHQMNMNQSRSQLKRIYERQISIYIEKIYCKRQNTNKTEKNTFVYVCLFLVGTKCQDILTYFDNISGGLFRSLRTSIRIRSSKSEASEADNSELSMPSWKGGECFDLLGGWGGVQSEFRTQQKLTENRKTYYSIKPTKNIPGIAICFSKFVLMNWRSPKLFKKNRYSRFTNFLMFFSLK